MTAATEFQAEGSGWYICLTADGVLVRAHDDEYAPGDAAAFAEALSSAARISATNNRISCD